MIAYLDESARAPARLYVVAVGVVAITDAAEAIDELSGVPAGSAHRFHWRNETEPVKARMLEVIRKLRIRTYAALYSTEHRGWARRGRVQAIKGLLWELQTSEPELLELVIESRGAPGDAEDRKTIGHAQRSGHAQRQLVYGFDSPQKNPLLWVPDAIAGAVGSSFADGIDDYLEQLGDDAAPTIIDAEP